jgi:hypothetical protein
VHGQRGAHIVSLTALLFGGLRAGGGFRFCMVAAAAAAVGVVWKGRPLERVARQVKHAQQLVLGGC